MNVSSHSSLTRARRRSTRADSGFLRIVGAPIARSRRASREPEHVLHPCEDCLGPRKWPLLPVAGRAAVQVLAGTGDNVTANELQEDSGPNHASLRKPSTPGRRNGYLSKNCGSRRAHRRECWFGTIRQSRRGRSGPLLWATSNGHGDHARFPEKQQRAATRVRRLHWNGCGRLTRWPSRRRLTARFVPERSSDPRPNALLLRH
jgi:hypothetical protein